MVLAARTDTEPVVLDLGTTISSLCEESCLAVGQRDRVRVLLAVLVYRSLFQLCGPGNSLCWSSVLRFCGYLDRVFPVASFPLVHLGEPSYFHETFRWTCPARRETSSNRIRFRPTYIKPSSLNYPRRLVTVSRVLPIKLAITSRSSAEVFRIEETSKGREAASEDAAALRRFTWHGARVGPHQSGQSHLWMFAEVCGNSRRCSSNGWLVRGSGEDTQAVAEVPRSMQTWIKNGED